MAIPKDPESKKSATDKKSETTKLTSVEVASVKGKLEAFMKHSLDKEELNAFNELINSSGVKRLEKSDPTFFKSVEPDIAGLAKGVQEVIAAKKTNKADWDYTVWSYKF